VDIAERRALGEQHDAVGGIAEPAALIEECRASVDCTGFYFGTECGMLRKIASLCVVLAVLAVVLTGPPARGQNGPAPSSNADPCTKQVCEDGFTKQLSDEEKKVFAACVAQKKCTSVGKTENPLISPFPR
jgi:hypothetical protein